MSLYPFLFRRLDDAGVVAVSESGDHIFLAQRDLEQIVRHPENLPLDKVAELKSKFFIGNASESGVRRLLASRIAAKKETVLSGPSLHIVVPTLYCQHSCRYCQVSRSLVDEGYSMSLADLDAVIETIFQSPSKTLTVEFQGGDPLLRYDLVRHGIERITARNRRESRTIRIVVASTLHQLDAAMCEFFKAHRVYLSTSIDGPAALHNKNRPLPSRDSFDRTLEGIRLAQSLIGAGAVSALMTTTRESLGAAEEIVDTYVALGLKEVFIRPLSRYGFAVRNQRLLTYSNSDFYSFYRRAFERVLYWNREGVSIREVAASIALNKILSPFDGGYVDLQSPSGAGLAVLVYNYDGFVYPSDEARMLAAAGDNSLRLGRIGESLRALLGSDLQRKLTASSLSHIAPGCRDCAYHSYCGPDPINAYNQWGLFSVPAYWTQHCQHQLWLFDFLFRRLRESDGWFNELAQRWAQPYHSEDEPVDA